MKESILYRKWADMLDMCEGTSIDHNTCWKYKGKIQSGKFMFGSFNNVNDYEFALCILENKPVFPCDTLYFNDQYGKVLSFYNDIFIFDDVDGDTVPSHKNYVSWKEPVDPYAELKQAQKEGKKLAWLSDNNLWVEACINTFIDHQSRYKIVKDDLVDSGTLITIFGSYKIIITKSGLNGEVTARVAEEV